MTVLFVLLAAVNVTSVLVQHYLAQNIVKILHDRKSNDARTRDIRITSSRAAAGAIVFFGSGMQRKVASP